MPQHTNEFGTKVPLKSVLEPTLIPCQVTSFTERQLLLCVTRGTSVPCTPPEFYIL